MPPIEETLALDRKRAEADKDDARAQQDVTVDLDRIADIKLEAGDSSGALAAFEEALAFAATRQGEPDEEDCNARSRSASARSAT